MVKMAIPYPSFLFIVVLTIYSLISTPAINAYEPTWDSLDSRPLPSWYDDAKIGIFVHWGVFSVPSFRSEWFWWDWQGAKDKDVQDFMAQNYKPGFTYGDFAKQFTAEFYEPAQWVQMFKDSGAKYIVLTSKHHEGYTNWPSKYSFNWNSMDVGPMRDLVGELANATRQNSDLKFGLYHSMFEWFHPLYLSDKKSNWTQQDFVNQKTLPELYEIVNKYQPDVVWSDGDWEAPDTYWKSKEFLAWLYTNSSVKDSVVANDRFGSNVMCHHSGIYTCGDRYNPGVLQKHKWENAMTIDKLSWGYRRNAKLSDYLSIEDLLQTFIKTISCGGNMLMNVGPPSHGHIAPIYEERLSQMGSWLKVNGDAVYSSRPWTFQNDTVTKDVWYTKKTNSSGTTVYAFIFAWPDSDTLTIGAPKASVATTVSLLGMMQPLSYKTMSPHGLIVQMPNLSFAELPCKWIWVLKMTAIDN